MKSFARARSFAALTMALLMLAMPLTALAKKGEKNYKRGLQHEQAQQWEKAAQEFALALAALPSDTEYQLHYRRAVFNASQVFMQKGRALAEQNDYVGAYNAFRQAYGYDPVNELAASEMRRMLRLQREKEGLDPDEVDQPARPGAARSVTPGTTSQATPRAVQESLPPSRVEQLRTIQYNGDLEPFIRQLAEELNLNVIFDQTFLQQRRNINVKLKDVTAARALDYIFTAYGLFFQRLDRRTIIVADQSKRPQFQQLVLRTFYLYNIDPADARTLIQAALPPNAGRQPQVVTNKTTNSITVRDTPENVRIIEQLLQTVDKDRAEVVMEVSIYEVSRTDLLQIGNQIGTADTLGNLGGIQPSSVIIGGARQIANGANAVFPLSTGLGLLIPATTISALQSKDNTRLVFSTQVHAFDGEKSETRIGAKVPVQTASVTPFGGFVGGQQGTGTGTPTTPGVFGGNGFPVIQYEDTGLSLDFTPKVYPNHEVEVKMVIETKDTSVTGSGAASALTPTFTQRRITGTARIQNGKTMMIASVASDRESQGRAGLPLVGLIPILGRLFTAPRRNNAQSDVVITMTPRVLRAPQIGPEDERVTPSGSMQTPTSESLEAMLRDAEREDQLAAARSLPKNQTVQLPPQPGDEEVTFVPAPKALAESAAAISSAATGAANPAVNASHKVETTPAPAANTSPAGATPAPNAATQPARSATAELSAELMLLPERQDLKVGEKRRVMLMLKTDAGLGLATAVMRFDPRAVAVRAVSQDTLGGDKSKSPVITQSVDSSGVMLLSVAPAAGGLPLSGEGLLLVLEIEALTAGESSLSFDASKVNFIAADGRAVRAKAGEAKLTVVQ